MSIFDLVEQLQNEAEENKFEVFRKVVKGLTFDELNTFREAETDVKWRNYIDFELGVRRGWWENWDKKEPIPHPILCDFDGLTELGVKFLSQLMARLEFFDSVKEAKQAGWIGKLERGEFKVKFGGFQKARVIVTDM